MKIFRLSGPSVQIIKISSIYRSQVWGWNGAFSKAFDVESCDEVGVGRENIYEEIFVRRFVWFFETAEQRKETTLDLLVTENGTKKIRAILYKISLT